MGVTGFKEKGGGKRITIQSSPPLLENSKKNSVKASYKDTLYTRPP